MLTIPEIQKLKVAQDGMAFNGRFYWNDGISYNAGSRPR